MAIGSMDNLMAALSGGQMYRSDWNKNALPVTAQALGQWYDLSTGAGNPMMNSLIGSQANLTHQGITETTTLTAASGASGGNITTTVFTDTTHGSGRFTVGMQLTGAGILPGTYIISLGTGTGANSGGTYNINLSQTVTSQTITGTGTPGGIYHGGDVGASNKHLLNASAFSAAVTTAPSIIMLYDMLATYTITTTTLTTVQTFLSQAAWPRYADGKGVRAFLVPSIVMGAGTPTVQLTYTNPASVGSRVTPGAPSLPIVNTTCPVGAVAYSGTGVGKYGPFLPLQSGDAGIQSVQSIQFNATMTSGVMNLVICKPLAFLPITTQGVAAERDFVNMLPSMPRIYDGAVIHAAMYAGALTPINSSFYGHIDVAWG
jgi:hypothetical protein